MPPDNAGALERSSAVSFPQNGSASGSAIARSGPSAFTLSAIGTYQVMFQVGVSDQGQLVLSLDTGSGPQELPYTVVESGTGGGQIIGTSLVTTTSVNSLLSVRVPARGNALRVARSAGGGDPVTAHLVITRIQ
jgi:hypothetical protein